MRKGDWVLVDGKQYQVLAIKGDNITIMGDIFNGGGIRTISINDVQII